MITKNVKLYETPMHEFSDEVTLDIYVHEPYEEITKTKRPVMIVFPGGGYAFTSRREAECIAISYYAQGFNAYVCNYTVTEEKCRKVNPLIDAANAIAYARRHAAEHNNDPDKLAVIGFSAGGHLACHIAVSCHSMEVARMAGFDSTDDIKVNAAVLGYPVISGTNHPHDGSFVQLLGQNRTEEELKAYSLENLVTPDCPPMFIWSTSADDCVPCQNALCLANALADVNVPFELHVFPYGKHGLSLANWETNPDWSLERDYDLPYDARWLKWSIMWLNECVCFGICK